uniref:Uncharacterized protein n=1 Tax=Rhizophora mucronata TaxID=61149 RepID=A0A2P2IS44_RHIMU
MNAMSTGSEDMFSIIVGVGFHLGYVFMH